MRKIEKALEDPNWWKKTGYERCLLDKQNKDCLDKLLKEELVPSNSWRGKLKWQGSSYLTSRLSLSSEGSYISDHRYNQELSTPTIDQLIGSSVESNVYEPLNIHLNLAHILVSLFLNFRFTIKNICVNHFFQFQF